MEIFSDLLFYTLLFIVYSLSWMLMLFIKFAFLAYFAVLDDKKGHGKGGSETSLDNHEKFDFHHEKNLLKRIPLLLFAAYFFVNDIYHNYILSVLMIDLPDEWNETITQRMKRYKLDYGFFAMNTSHFDNIKKFSYVGYYKVKYLRYSFAVFVCKMLNKFDKEHC